jgi:hypothetical protein
LLADMEELLTRIDVVGEEIAEGNQCQEQECDCGSNFHFTLSFFELICCLPSDRGLS